MIALEKNTLFMERRTQLLWIIRVLLSVYYRELSVLFFFDNEAGWSIMFPFFDLNRQNGNWCKLLLIYNDENFSLNRSFHKSTAMSWVNQLIANYRKILNWLLLFWSNGIRCGYFFITLVCKLIERKSKTNALRIAQLFMQNQHSFIIRILMPNFIE